MQGEVRKVLFNLWKPTLRSLFESSESTQRPGERRLKVFMKRNLILNQRSRFISDTKMGLSFSPCYCLFWNEYQRQSLRERPAALCWKVIFESTLIQVKYRFYADRPFFSHLEKMQEFSSDGILLQGRDVPYLSLYFLGIQHCQTPSKQAFGKCLLKLNCGRRAWFCKGPQPFIFLWLNVPCTKYETLIFQVPFWFNIFF